MPAGTPDNAPADTLRKARLTAAIPMPWVPAAGRSAFVDNNNAAGVAPRLRRRCARLLPAVCAFACEYRRRRCNRERLDTKTMTEQTDITRLVKDGKVIVLIGTAHVSRQSVELTARVIVQERPDTVCIELCRSRWQAVTRRHEGRESDLLEVIRKKRVFFPLSNFFLTYIQNKIGQRVGITPGQEILTAIEAAAAVGAEIHLVDREVGITLLRAWRSMGPRMKLKLLGRLLTALGELDAVTEQEIEKMKQRDVLDGMLTELGRSLPTVARVLIDERDQYLAQRIRTAPGEKIVAVVGAGHVPGIKKYWEQPIAMEQLNRVPPPGKIARLLKWGLPVLIVAVAATGCVHAGRAAGTAIRELPALG